MCENTNELEKYNQFYFKEINSKTVRMAGIFKLFP